MNKAIPLYFLFIFQAIALADLKVMIIDSGVDATIPALQKYTTQRDNTDDNGHGTHIAGIITRQACADVHIIPCKFYEDGRPNIDAEVSCIHEAIVMNVDVINFSGGGAKPDINERGAIRAFLSRQGTQFISSAGNEGWNLDEHSYYPCSYRYQGQTCVGAVGTGNRPLVSSNRAPWVEWRPGLSIESWLPGGRRGTMSGTSQAAAMATAARVHAWCRANAQGGRK